MQHRYEAPQVGKDAFHCPSCGAYAHQTWYQTQVLRLDDETTELVPDEQAENPTLQALSNLTRALSPATVVSSQFRVSHCERCTELAVWMHERLLWPHGGSAPPPNVDLPEQVADDYREAAAIAHDSPRGAAALLRLAVEKLCRHLVSPHKNLYDCIRILVAKGLEPGSSKPSTMSGVIGNNAVHPDNIDRRDDAPTVATLFNLVNVIAEQTITRPKQMQTMYDTLPATERRKVEARDGNPPRD